MVYVRKTENRREMSRDPSPRGGHMGLTTDPTLAHVLSCDAEDSKRRFEQEESAGSTREMAKQRGA